MYDAVDDRTATGNLALADLPTQSADVVPSQSSPLSPPEWVEAMLRQAIALGATDVHLEPFPNGLRVRMRVDGQLRGMEGFTEADLTMTGVLKARAGVEVADARFPQDGRFRLGEGASGVEVRLSTFPVRGGESVVLRLLDARRTGLSLDRLGMEPAMCERLRFLLAQASGMITFCGPTGSGKTTSLYAALREIASPTRKVITLEDPVEYRLPGLLQVAVDDQAGRGFAVTLRSLLRHDPDVLMVGEIRDADTAQTAIAASLTGHLLLTTVHAADEPATLLRMIDLGVEPALLPGAIKAMIAQRLPRTLCPQCRKVVANPEEVWQALYPDTTLHPSDAASRRADVPLRNGQPVSTGLMLWEASLEGGVEGKHRGWGGRRGVFSMLEPSDSWEALLPSHANRDRLLAAARAEGWQSLREVAQPLLLKGELSPSEVLRLM